MNQLSKIYVTKRRSSSSLLANCFIRSWREKNTFPPVGWKRLSLICTSCWEGHLWMKLSRTCWSWRFVLKASVLNQQWQAQIFLPSFKDAFTTIMTLSHKIGQIFNQTNKHVSCILVWMNAWWRLGLAWLMATGCIVHMDGVEFDQTSKQTGMSNYIFLVGLGWGPGGTMGNGSVIPFLENCYLQFSIFHFPFAVCLSL